MTTQIYMQMINSESEIYGARLIGLIVSNLYFENTSDEVLDCELNIAMITNITNDTKVILNRFFRNDVQPNEEINFNNVSIIPKSVYDDIIFHNDHCIYVEVYVSGGTSEEKRLLMVKKTYTDNNELMVY